MRRGKRGWRRGVDEGDGRGIKGWGDGEKEVRGYIIRIYPRYGFSGFIKFIRPLAGQHLSIQFKTIVYFSMGVEWG
jgi:hypothetical protein